MIWEGLTDGQLLRVVQGSEAERPLRSVQQIVEHMSTPLVLWGWHPGEGRSVIPMSLGEFQARVRDWAANGAACPDNSTIPKSNDEESALSDTLAAFLIGGLVVSAFATVAGLFKPTSFAGLFEAPAPSVALATLALTISKDGKDFCCGYECRSMIAGAVGLCVYSLVVSQFLARFRLSALMATFTAMPLWFLTAFGLWRIFLR